MSELKVNKISPRSGTDVTLGDSGDTITIASGATFNTGSATVTLPSTINATTINVTTVVLAAGAVGTPSLTTSGDTNTGIFFPTADTIAFTEGGSEAMRINSDSQIVHALGTVSLPSITFTGDVNTGIFSPTADTIAFTEGGAERMRITSDGDVLVGVASISTVRLAVASASAFIMVGRNSAGTVDQIRIDSVGNVSNTNNSYGGLSDIKLKENIVDATPKLDKLKKIRIVNYNLKTNPEKKLLGVVAQELEEIFPGMIDESPEHDEEGNYLSTTIKSIKYSVFVPMLIKAIQEQQAIIEELKATSTSQQTKIDVLEARLTALENN